jgi:hypothetical protein
MTVGAMGRHRNSPSAARSMPMPSLLTSPATSASAGSPSRGGRNCRRGGGLEPVAPPTASEGWLGGAGLSATRGRPSRWAPHEDGPPAGPLGWGELLVSSLSPHSCCARPSVAATTMTLLWRGEATTRTTPPCRSNPPPRWPRCRSTTAPATIFIGGDAKLPRLPPLDAVVVPIVLGDLALFVWRLARGTPPRRDRFVPVEDHLLR